MIDTALTELFGWQFLLLCLVVTALTTILRKIVEYLIEMDDVSAKLQKMWTDLILPLAPLLLGILFCALFSSYPYPAAIVGKGTRIAFGLVAGLLSTTVFRVINSFFGSKIKEYSPEAYEKFNKIETEIELHDHSVVHESTTTVERKIHVPPPPSDEAVSDTATDAPNDVPGAAKK